MFKDKTAGLKFTIAFVSNFTGFTVLIITINQRICKVVFVLPVGARGLDLLELRGDRLKGMEVGGVLLSLVTPSFRPDYLAPLFSSHLARFNVKFLVL